MAHAPMRPADLGHLKAGGGQHVPQLADEVRPHGVPAVEETADGEQDPGGTGRGCAEVDQQEPAVWYEHPTDLTQSGGLHCVREVMEDQRADHQLERFVGKRQVLGVALDELHRRRAGLQTSTGCGQHLKVGVDPGKSGLGLTGDERLKQRPSSAA
jgi:hypothetical protein